MSTTRAAGARGRAREEDEAELGQDASERPRRSAADAELLLLEVLGSDADGLLQVARRHSICFDDAHDAYQRALEQFFSRARHLRAATAREYLYTWV